MIRSVGSASHAGPENGGPRERELGVLFGTIVVCAATGSTQAGMIAGFAVQDRPRKVLGIDGSATVSKTWEQITRIARRTAEAIGLARDLSDDERCGDPEPTGSCDCSIGSSMAELSHTREPTPK